MSLYMILDKDREIPAAIGDIDPELIPNIYTAEEIEVVLRDPAIDALIIDPATLQRLENDFMSTQILLDDQTPLILYIESEQDLPCQESDEDCAENIIGYVTDALFATPELASRTLQTIAALTQGHLVQECRETAQATLTGLSMTFPEMKAAVA